jgi:hypothetical protein
MKTESMMHHSPLDPLAWPVAVASVTVASVSNWLWEHAPTPTAFYMAVSAGFMLFQMLDKMGLLERLKRPRLHSAPRDEHET